MTNAIPASGVVFTDEHGRIVDISHDGAAMLNLSRRGAQGRKLPLFVVHDRLELLRQLEIAARGHDVIVSTVLRPLEGAPRRVRMEIRRCDDERLAGELQWLVRLD